MTSSRTGKIIDIKGLVYYSKAAIATCRKDWFRFSDNIKINGFFVSDLVVIEYLIQKNGLTSVKAEDFRRECLNNLRQMKIPEEINNKGNREAALSMINQGTFLRNIWEIYLIDPSMPSKEKTAYLNFFEKHFHQGSIPFLLYSNWYSRISPKMYEFSRTQEEQNRLRHVEFSFDSKTHTVRIKEGVSIHQLYDNKAVDPKKPVVADEKPLIEGTLTHELLLAPRGDEYAVKVRHFEPEITGNNPEIGKILFGSVEQDQEIQLMLDELNKCKKEVSELEVTDNDYTSKPRKLQTIEALIKCLQNDKIIPQERLFKFSELFVTAKAILAADGSPPSLSKFFKKKSSAESFIDIATQILVKYLLYKDESKKNEGTARKKIF